MSRFGLGVSGPNLGCQGLALGCLGQIWDLEASFGVSGVALGSPMGFGISGLALGCQGGVFGARSRSEPGALWHFRTGFGMPVVISGLALGCQGVSLGCQGVFGAH